MARTQQLQAGVARLPEDERVSEYRPHWRDAHATKFGHPRAVLGTMATLPLVETLEQRMFLSVSPAVVEPAEAVRSAAVFRRVTTTPLIVDHTSIAGVARIAQTTMVRIASTLNFLFAHASVGGNILDGMNALHSANPGRYKLGVVSTSQTPPATTIKGRVYELDRGNPPWQEKVDSFAGYLAGGWAAKINVAMNKFCFIDPDATVQYYALSNAKNTAMSQLEAKYPNVKFVYVTIPLTTGTDADNVKRNNFNTTLRKWARAHGKVLFDLADIEAWSPAGKQSTFTSSGTTYQRLYSGYAADEGHLNTTGGKREALAWYALAAGLIAR
ncbi:MAG: hypothetical protein ABSH20_29400 [Tepidisphaeraceae bacterium]|jgi:hypothetical protein